MSIADFLRLRTKPRVSYTELSSDSDLDSDSNNSSNLAESSSRVQPRRSSRRANAYQSDTSLNDEDDELNDPAPSHTRPSRHSTRNTIATRSRNTNAITESVEYRPKRTRQPPCTYPSDESEDELPKKKKRKIARPPTPKSPKSIATSFNNSHTIFSCRSSNTQLIRYTTFAHFSPPHLQLGSSK